MPENYLSTSRFADISRFLLIFLYTKFQKNSLGSLLLRKIVIKLAALDRNIFTSDQTVFSNI